MIYIYCTRTILLQIIYIQGRARGLAMGVIRILKLPESYQPYRPFVLSVCLSRWVTVNLSGKASMNVVPAG